ncbi:MAG TPA: adenine phosphoribosyltransferase [Candidatus Acidoferrum sp.]|nr:adenine phosphoribosyltransferase [Candidatus Acidoferrum sp.]
MDSPIQVIKEKIREIPDFPKKGISFKDITPLLQDKRAFALCVDEMARLMSTKDIDYVAGIEARGFLIGAPVAYKLNKGIITIRKKGKLPYKRVSFDYELEYGTSTIEVHEDAVKKGDNIAIVDDLLATGGTAKAAAELIKSLGGNVSLFAFVVELEGLKGREKLAGHDIVSLLKY